MIDDGFDAVIRSGDLPDSGLIARGLGSFQTGLFASPEYLRRRGIPLQPHDLERHCCVQFRNHASGKLQQWAMRVDPGESEPRLPISMICNNIEALLAAAIHGIGVAYMPAFLARDAVASGTLVPLLEHYLLPQEQLCLLWPSNRQMTPKLRVFVDFLCDRVSLSQVR